MAMLVSDRLCCIIFIIFTNYLYSELGNRVCGLLPKSNGQANNTHQCIEVIDMPSNHTCEWGRERDSGQTRWLAWATATPDGCSAARKVAATMRASHSCWEAPAGGAASAVAAAVLPLPPRSSLRSRDHLAPGWPPSAYVLPRCLKGGRSADE